MSTLATETSSETVKKEPIVSFPASHKSARPVWITDLQKAADAQFAQAGFPKNTEEDWRHTNLSALQSTQFVAASSDVTEEAKKLARCASFGNDALIELVFVNGVYVPSLSKLAGLPKGVTVSTLLEAATKNTPLVQKHLGKYVDDKSNPFAAMNTAHFVDGAFVHLARSAEVNSPIHVIFVSTSSGKPSVSHPRILAIAEENSQGSLVATYVGSSSVYFTNPVTEIVVAQNAHFDFNKLHQESDSAFHVSASAADLSDKSVFISHDVTLGGKLTRNDYNVKMAGEYADATINGLIYLPKNSHCDNHTLLDHAKANCPSHELYKYILDGTSTAVFKGKILVRKDSQKTDSKQTSKALLLSDNAKIDSMPALEIYADDVKCTHGSTTGPVDEEQVFYLRSRGVGYDAARHLLTYAFAADITRRIKVGPVRQRIEDYLAALQGLPQDLRITDLGSHDERARNL